MTRGIHGWLIGCLVLALGAGAGIAAPAEPPVAPNIEAAIDRGLFFLQKMQKADGSFDAVGPDHAITGLALMAFLSGGHTPDVGKYGLTVRNAVEFLLNAKAPDGYFGRDGSRMYGHCIVTIALAEVYGTELDEAQRARVRAALEKALKVILDAQAVSKDAAQAGGWRYEPSSTDSDLSVTAWCALALRACQNAGLSVPKQNVDQAVAYILRCYNADSSAFAYQPREAPTIAMTSAALLNLYLLDAGAREEVVRARKYLLAQKVADQTPYYYYSTYYATQAAFQAGEGVWPEVWKRTSDQLLPAQRRDDGSWPPRNGEPGGDHARGRVYATTLSVLTLSVPLRLLPIYQR